MRAESTGAGTEHDRLLQEAINAARSVAWRGSGDDLPAERHSGRAYREFCSRHGLPPLPIEVH